MTTSSRSLAVFLLISVFSGCFYTLEAVNDDERTQKVFNTADQDAESLNEIESVDRHWVDEFDYDNLSESSKYVPTWDSLDSRPLPSWYDQSKIGIFIHWGVFSVPGNSEWFWYRWKAGDNESIRYMEENFKPGTTYQEFGPQFTAEFYDPKLWANIFQRSGARYIVLTSKHHEGYTLWPSKYSFGWNSQDVGPNRDLVGDLAAAIRNTTNLKFGLYHSLFEFYNPLYLQDRQNNYTTDIFVRYKTIPELYEIVNSYQPDVIWSDGEWEASSDYWHSRKFLTWLYNESPVRDTVVTNDRWGKDTMCKHGGYFTCQDNYNPGVLQPRKWENCFPLDKDSWGYRRKANVEDYLTPEELIRRIVETVSCGGNVLINVGPTREGTIVPIQQERLLQMGEWLEVNGEAIYETVAYTNQNDTITPGIWYTKSADGTRVYGMITIWPGSNVIVGVISPSKNLTVNMLGFTGGKLSWRPHSQGIEIRLPRPDEINSKWAWTLVFSSL